MTAFRAAAGAVPMEQANGRRSPEMTIEYCGEWYPVSAGAPFVVGRAADLAIDDNPFIPVRLLELREADGVLVLRHVATRLSVSASDPAGRLTATLLPGSAVPIVLRTTTIAFAAGPTTYEFAVHLRSPVYADHPVAVVPGVIDPDLTPTQKLVIVALAEPLLRRGEGSMAGIPTTAQAAARLGWSLTRFNRKLDNVCEKFDRLGIEGLRGGVRSYATNRRIRLIEYSIAAEIVGRTDLGLLDSAGAVTATRSLGGDG